MYFNFCSDKFYNYVVAEGLCEVEAAAVLKWLFIKELNVKSSEQVKILR
jgi:hypothetical protein